MSRHRHRHTYVATKDGLVELTPQDIAVRPELKAVLSPAEGEEDAEFAQEVALSVLREDARTREMCLFLSSLEYPRKLDTGIVTNPPMVAQRERDPHYVPGYV